MDALTRERFGREGAAWFTAHPSTGDGPSSPASALELDALGAAGPVACGESDSTVGAPEPSEPSARQAGGPDVSLVMLLTRDHATTVLGRTS